MAVADKKKKIFDNRYEIHSIVGRGSKSVVYRARHIEGGREDVALKVLVSKKGQKATSDLLRKEALAIVSSRHKYVIRLDDFHSVGDLCYLAMEFAALGDLRQYTQKTKKPLSTTQAELFLLQSAEALDFIHRAGILHRDIKPDNLLVIDEQNIRIGDFGVAILPGEKSSLEELQRGVGTMSYMSAEVLEGQGYDRRSDIFALGVTFYEMLTGQHPFEDAPLAEQVEVRKEDKYPPLDSIVSDAPKHLTYAISKMMAFDTENRFQTCRELVQSLISFESGDGTKSTPPKQPVQAKTKREETITETREKPQPQKAPQSEKAKAEPKAEPKRAKPAEPPKKEVQAEKPAEEEPKKKTAKDSTPDSEEKQQKDPRESKPRRRRRRRRKRKQAAEQAKEESTPKEEGKAESAPTPPEPKPEPPKKEKKPEPKPEKEEASGSEEVSQEETPAPEKEETPPRPKERIRQERPEMRTKPKESEEREDEISGMQQEMEANRPERQPKPIGPRQPIEPEPIRKRPSQPEQEQIEAVEEEAPRAREAITPADDPFESRRSKKRSSSAPSSGKLFWGAIIVGSVIALYIAPGFFGSSEPTDSSSFTPPSNQESALPQAAAGDLNFPQLAPGSYKGLLTPGDGSDPIPMLVLSLPEKGELLIAFGKAGMRPTQVAIPQDGEGAINVSMNGRLIELKGQAAESAVHGVYTDLVSGEIGEWKLTPLQQ